MAIRKKKSFQLRMSDLGQSKRSDLAKQAINAICTDVSRTDPGMDEIRRVVKADQDKVFEDKLKSIDDRIAELEVQLAVGECQCCEKGGIKTSELVKIDSGQFLCASCLAELRA